MALIINKKAVFIHLPKTGGSFLRNVITKFNEDSVDDRSKGWHRTLDSHDLSKYDYTFSIVRNPITWYESVWKHICAVNHTRIGWGNEEHQLSFLHQYHDPVFSRFIDNVIANCPGYYSESLKGFIGDNYDSVNYIAKTETLYHDACRIMDALDIKYDTQAVLASPTFHRPATCEWSSNSQKEELLKLESKIIDKFYK